MRGDDDVRRPGFDDDEVSVVRSEEELDVGYVEREVGRARVRKLIDEQPFDDVVPRGVEHAEIERVPANEGDSGEIETLADGSVSIPVLEEQIVVEKRLIVRERVIVRKVVVQEEERIRTTLRRELVEVEADPEAVANVHVDDGGTPLPG